MSGAAGEAVANPEIIECDVCAGRAPTKRSRQELLGALEIGDIFAADHLCLVVSIENDTIHARRLIVSQSRSFNRATGEETTEGRIGRSEVSSVEPLPADIHDMILWLDRKNRLLTDMSKAKLTDAEKHALLFVSDHHAANPI